MKPAETRVEKTDEEWRELLGDEQTFRICRKGGTELRFSGAYLDEKTPGLYRCRCCALALFRSETKFDSGSGWPSFSAAVDRAAIRELQDTSHGMIRTEVRCARCDAHLGHVFPDGPRPSGLRYCVNSASLQHEPD